jgi:hypothetical protein
MENINSSSLSALLVTLLKGVIYRDKNPDLWQSLSGLYAQVAEQGAILGLDCVVDENEGYAYFRQKDTEEGETAIPRLVQKRQLSYSVSLLCVLLRKKIVETDAGGDASRVILTREQIIDLMRIYMPDMGNEVKMIEQIDTALRRVIEMGFIRTLEHGKDTYEVRRILRAFVDADWISSLDEKLESYREYINEQ